MPVSLRDGAHPKPPSSRPASRLTTLISLCAVALVLTLSYLTLNPSLSLTTPSSPPPSSSTPVPCPPLPDELNITYHRKDTPLAPSPLPPPHHSSDAHLIIPLLLSLTRSTTFTLVSSLPLRAPDTFEPEGLLLLRPSRLVLSSAEYTSPTAANGTDRTPGSGHAHLQVFDLSDGSLIADASISRPGSPEYHNGGIDYDGRRIHGVLSQRRPASSATIYAADPHTLRPSALAHHPSDHLGALAVDPARRLATALNWGSRHAAAFPLPGPDAGDGCTSRPPRSTAPNPSHFVDYQDCKFLGPHEGRDLMLCSGVSTLSGEEDGHERYVLGGIALVDTESMMPVFEVPIALESDRGVRMTMNPFDVGVEDGRLRFYWAPDQHNTTLYIYETRP